jgi:hypothetical protein
MAHGQIPAARCTIAGGGMCQDSPLVDKNTERIRRHFFVVFGILGAGPADEIGTRIVGDLTRASTLSSIV